ncbi:metallophosphoesterase [Verminephrobacter aporrectodeae subsp. tuberculatae]|uniref:Metallophosphoesterase n=1 Tax=Verminephrobacter aporrectodeae subsp. tuberculatae TaxID=1110392 RepID=A0ABT3KN50_9BURK|nr:metallophosphoesterase [Verminephrobacter aporrectodeae]MCW5254864.1 metallophosphoesterase [Verminephrobacter aporrectodeae subsp. tuberculatae]MCW5319705.1 metallophosphoesterase [Verminephrobacter aporrectodeae subsp. tuberculatae]MCW8205556.1 metallophosphoesterase [Verminephrobacter aporrectodeae subsp. tuberculatae]
MNIQLLSDLHLEVQPHFVPEPTPGASVLVLAGDIGSYQPGSQLGDDDFGLARFSPLPQYAGWPTPVLFVPGNHEYDALDFDAAHQRLRCTCERLGITWLERESVLLQGVRFVGTTLWSDFDALAGGAGPNDPGLRLKLRDKAFRAANFYLRRTGGTRAGVPFLAEPMRAQALACQQWLEAALQVPFAGPTVVVTHFAPSLRSADPRYGLVPATAGFCNALDALLARARLWLHGHLHAPSDYWVQGTRSDGSAWQCRVVANPLGYARKGEQTAFQPRGSIAV